MVPVGSVTDENAAEWLAYVERRQNDSGTRPPKTLLLNFPQLLKKVRKPQSAGDRSNQNGIVISDSELQWLTRFHDDVRNQFTHFSPMGWSIEVSGVPNLTNLGVRLIREIADFGWAFRHKDEAWLKKLQASLTELEGIAESA
jgi:hypothetical protein